METRIDFEEVFLDTVKTGINLFTGAGFSVLPDSDGHSLPKGSDLAVKICEDFGLPKSLSNDLELVSTSARNKDAIGFDNYLREVYRVSDCNVLYDAINLMNIQSYITTNIDNLFQTIVEKDDKRYVNSVVNGKAKRKGNPINYIPLHGDITDTESHLYFGGLEIARAASENSRLFEVMKNEVYRNPTLFWGYGFHDSSVMSTLGSILTDNAKNVWIQFTKDNIDKAEIYRALGFNIIIGDTEGLLNYIADRLGSTKPSIPITDSIPDIWNDYVIPTLNQQRINISAEDYFKNGKMAWNVIFSGYPYETSYVKEAYERFLKNKNLVIVGSSQCGKTTLLRQLSLVIKRQVFYISELSENQAHKLVKSLSSEICVFVDDCSRDMKAFAILAENSHIHLVGITDENGFESSKHLISDVDYQTYFLSDLCKEEANSSYEHISASIRKTQFKYSKKSNEKYSYLEFGFDNIQDIISKDKIEKFLSSIVDEQIKEILFITAYLCTNGSYLSTDILWKIVDVSTYADLKEVIKRTNQALASIDEVMDEDLEDQDYYILRSNAFSKYLIEAAIEKHKIGFGKAIRRLIEEVPRGLITRYNVYRRTAYDANIFYKIYGSKALDLYDLIYSFDSSPYTLQQKALYLSRNHKFSEAFSVIDKANQDMPSNWSIKNAKAVITFEANKNSKEPEAKLQLDKAMAILAECYKSDKRKVYHAQKYAKYALYTSRVFDDGQYLKTAKEWLEKEAECRSISSWITKLLEEVSTEMNLS